MLSKARRLFAVLLAAVGWVPALAQLQDADIQALQARGRQEGWTFSVGHNSATKYHIAHLCSLAEPADWHQKARFVKMREGSGLLIAGTTLVSGEAQATAGSSGVTAGALPAAFDWRTQAGLPPIRDQAACGSCWAFSTVGALECAIKIKDGVNTDLSEQWLISDNNDGWGCGGGWFAHDYHLRGSTKHDPYGDNGAVAEAAFPYVAQDVAPHGPYPHSYWLDNWAYIGTGSSVPTTDDIKRAIMTYGPVSVGIYANSAFQAYIGGIFNNNDDKTINHAVVLVGWDDTQGSNGVWILRNSWGTSWGESGYMRIQYGCSGVGYAANFVDYRTATGLQVSPSDGLGATGPPGGTFSPTSKAYTVHNAATHTVVWSANNAQPWVSITPASGSLGSGAQTTVTISINSAANALAAGNYADTVTITNLTDHDYQTRPVTLRVGQADYFTEFFGTTPNDVKGKMLTFTPNSSSNGYTATCADISAFPTDPTGGTRLALSDDGYSAINLTNGAQVALYGTYYAKFYVGANGYITFNGGDRTYSASLTNHFSRPRISALFEDLNPAAGGTVSWKQMSDHIAVTFQNVPEYNTTTTNNFQIELFTNGVIRLNYLNLDTVRGLVGLSRGKGVPADYQQSDLTAYPVSQIPSIALTVAANPSNGGIVSGSGTYAVGGSAKISADADLGWIFTGWNDGNISTVRSIIAPSNDVTYTANFSFKTNVTLTVLLQAGNGGMAGVWTLGTDYRPATWRSVTGLLGSGWILRAINQNRILLQQGDGGMIGLWDLTNSVPVRWWPVSAALPGWIARDLDGNRILLQAGTGGIVGVWTLDANNHPVTWTALNGPVAGLMARSLRDNQVLVQFGDSAPIGYWTLDGSNHITAWTPLSVALPAGWILRSMTSNYILLQAGDGGISGLWELDAQGTPIFWHLMANSLPGWILRGLDQQ